MESRDFNGFLSTSLFHFILQSIHFIGCVSGALHNHRIPCYVVSLGSLCEAGYSPSVFSGSSGDDGSFSVAPQDGRTVLRMLK